jgi:hypothetical protein
MSCLDTLMPQICPGANMVGNCWQPSAGSPDTSCSVCSKSSRYSDCVSCLKAKPYSRGCTNCAAMVDSTAQDGSTGYNTAQCFDCSLKTQPTYDPSHLDAVAPTCSSCTAPSLDFTQCLSCLLDPNIKEDACVSCVTTCSSFETRGVCFSCISKTSLFQENYSEGCKCTAGNTPPARERWAPEGAPPPASSKPGDLVFGPVMPMEQLQPNNNPANTAPANTALGGQDVTVCTVQDLDDTQRQLCTICLQGTATTDVSKQACAVCVTTCSSSASRDSCFTCIRSDPFYIENNNYSEACKCTEGDAPPHSTQLLRKVTLQGQLTTISTPPRSTAKPTTTKPCTLKASPSLRTTDGASGVSCIDLESCQGSVNGWLFQRARVLKEAAAGITNFVSTGSSSITTGSSTQ